MSGRHLLTKTIHVANIPHTVNKHHLSLLFLSSNINILLDRNKPGFNYAFINYDDNLQAEQVVKHCDGKYVEDLVRENNGAIDDIGFGVIGDGVNGLSGVGVNGVNGDACAESEFGDSGSKADFAGDNALSSRGEFGDSGSKADFAGDENDFTGLGVDGANSSALKPSSITKSGLSSKSHVPTAHSESSGVNLLSDGSKISQNGHGGDSKTGNANNSTGKSLGNGSKLNSVGIEKNGSSEKKIPENGVKDDIVNSLNKLKISQKTENEKSDGTGPIIENASNNLNHDIPSQDQNLNSDEINNKSNENIVSDNKNLQDSKVENYSLQSAVSPESNISIQQNFLESDNFTESNIPNYPPLKINWAYQSSSVANSQNNDTINIFVGDLSPEVDDLTLFNAFGQFNALQAHVMWDMQTSRSRGYGFVTFLFHQDAEAALQSMNGQIILNRAIRCNWASHRNNQKKNNHNHYQNQNQNQNYHQNNYQNYQNQSYHQNYNNHQTGHQNHQNNQNNQNHLNGHQNHQNNQNHQNGHQNHQNQNQNGHHTPQNHQNQNNYQQNTQNQRPKLLDSMPQFDIVLRQTPNWQTTVYLGNIAHFSHQSDLIPLLQNFGFICNFKFHPERGCAFVKYDSHERAALAIVQLAGMTINGRPLKCGWGKDKPPGYRMYRPMSPIRQDPPMFQN